MTDVSPIEKTSTSADVMTLAVVVIAICAGLISYFGNPFAALMGDNVLEKATRVGVSDKAKMDAFRNAGGLDKESSWKGFRVTELRVVYEDTGKLGMVILTVYKSFTGKKLASIDNLQSAMSSECGTNWTQSTRFGSAVLEGKNASTGVSCAALDQGGPTVEVTMAKTSGEKQSANSPPAPSQPPAQQSLATAPSPIENPPRNFEKEAASELAFVNPKEAMVDPAVLALVREKYPFEVVVFPPMEQGLRNLLGKDYSTLVDFLGVAGPLKVDPSTGDLYGEGMVAHSGGDQSGALTLSKKGRITVVLVDKTKPQSISVYGASSLSQLSASLANFVSESRRY